MSVVDFRPHTFSYRIVEPTTAPVYSNSILFSGKGGITTTTKGHVNGNGDYVPAPFTWSEPFKCNAVPNGGSASVKTAEGRCIEYSFTLYASTQVKDFLYGEVLRIERYGIVYELTVKGFQRYKGFVKIWV